VLDGDSRGVDDGGIVGTAFFDPPRARGKTMIRLPAEYDVMKHRTLGFACGDDEEQQKSEIEKYYAGNGGDLPQFAGIFTDWQKLAGELEAGDVLLLPRFGAISWNVDELREILRTLFGRGIIIVPVSDTYRMDVDLDDYRIKEPYMEKVKRYFEGLGELCQKMLREEEEEGKREQRGG
jgi:hypothetical protein